MQAIEVFPRSDNEANLQFNADGGIRHLLTLKGLDRSLLIELLDHAQRYVTEPGEATIRNRSLVGRTVANLFFEPSTRTRASFDLAADGAANVVLEGPAEVNFAGLIAL